MKPLQGLTVVALEQAVAGLWQHEQLAARGRWTTVDTRAGPVPALGEHTHAILRERGLAGRDFVALRAAGAVWPGTEPGPAATIRP